MNNSSWELELSCYLLYQAVQKHQGSISGLNWMEPFRRVDDTAQAKCFCNECKCFRFYICGPSSTFGKISGKKWGKSERYKHDLLGRWFPQCFLLHSPSLKATNTFSLRPCLFSISSASQLFETSVFNFKLGALPTHLLVIFLNLLFFLTWKLSCHSKLVFQAVTVLLKSHTVIN